MFTFVHLPLSNRCYSSKLSITLSIILWEKNPETAQIFVEVTVFRFGKQGNVSKVIQTACAATSGFIRKGHKCLCHFLKRRYSNHLCSFFLCCSKSQYILVHIKIEKKNFAISLYDLIWPVGPHGCRFLQPLP